MEKYDSDEQGITLRNINDWFSSNIPAFKHVKLIDDVKFLGQKLAKEYGEKDGTFV